MSSSLVIEEMTTEEELAEQLKLTVRQMGDFRRSQNLECLRFGRSLIRYTPDQVRKALAAAGMAAQPDIVPILARTPASRNRRKRSA